nr:crotonase/enoyl-CoA hydratase family protein [Sphingomonas sp. CCH18-H6]
MQGLVMVEKRGAVTLVGLNRAEKRNAFTIPMMQELAIAYGDFARDSDARCAILHAHGDHFCGGLDLQVVAADVMPLSSSGWLPREGVDPWAIRTPAVEKPVVCAVQGYCMTLSIELMLAADLSIASSDAVFAQLEVTRGLFPFGGSTARLVQAAGYQNAMRYLLTGDTFGSEETLRIGLVQQVVERGRQLEAALDIAHRISAAAPLAVAATLRSARRAVDHGNAAALSSLYSEIAGVYATQDAQTGIGTFLAKERPTYVGK